MGKFQVPIAAVVIMACNRADYLERTINSILKYVSLFLLIFSLSSSWTQTSVLRLFPILPVTPCNYAVEKLIQYFLLFRYQGIVASKFPLFVSQVPCIVVVQFCATLGILLCWIYLFPLKHFYHTSLFMQDGPNQDVKAKALSYKQITYMQVIF